MGPFLWNSLPTWIYGLCQMYHDLSRAPHYFFSWWPDRATKIINYQFLVARTGNLVARKKKSEMNGSYIRLRMTLKINVGCWK